MINIYNKKHTDKTSQILSDIKQVSGLQKEFNMILDVEIGHLPEEFNKFIDLYDSFNITNQDFSSLSEMDVFDMFIELINTKKSVYIENYESFMSNKELEQVVEDLDFYPYIINNDFDIDIKNPNINMCAAILEIFNKDIYSRYAKNIQLNGDFILDDNKIYLINRTDELYYKDTKDIISFILRNLDIKVFKANSNHIFSNFIPKNNGILKIDEEKIEIFKISVFNIIKNIKIDEIENYSLSIQKILAENEYISLDEIKKII